MSFGFSVGDFVAGANLVKDIINALNGSAELEYRELELELHGLQRALAELEYLEPETGQEAAVNSVKAAALMCRYPLEEFYGKLKQYRYLIEPGTKKKSEVVRGWGKKVQWSFSMPDEIQRLRAYVAAHVGSLNMRLMTLGLASMATAKRDSLEQKTELFSMLEQQALSANRSSTQSSLIYKLIVQSVLPQLQNIAGIAGNVLMSNLQILAYVAKINSPVVDLKHTWFQPPLRFEDALGRVVPLPVEYEWATAEAIIRSQFSSGPGHEKVFAGEYEIFCTNDSSKLVTRDSWALLQPGAAVIMAMVIGRCSRGLVDFCPRPGCLSRDFTQTQCGSTTCNKCHTRFMKARTPLTRPFRLLTLLQITMLDEGAHLKPESSKDCVKANQQQHDLLKQMRDERKWFKNVSLHYTDLPEVDQDGAIGATHGVTSSTKVAIRDSQELDQEIDKRESARTATMSELTRPNNSVHILLDTIDDPSALVSISILEYLAAALGVSASDLDASVPLSTYGIDSIIAVDLRRRIRGRYEVTLSVLDILLANDCSHLADLILVKGGVWAEQCPQRQN